MKKAPTIEDVQSIDMLLSSRGWRLIYEELQKIRDECLRSLIYAESDRVNSLQQRIQAIELVLQMPQQTKDKWQKLV